MARQGIDVFESTLQKTYEWLNDLMHLLNWSDRQRAYLALRITLQALRDRLPIDVATKFGAQLPMLIRGFYYEGWKPNLTPIKVKQVDDFLDFVAAHAMHSKVHHHIDYEQMVRAVFQVIIKHVSEGEVNHVRLALPSAIAELWESSFSLPESAYV